MEVPEKITKKHMNIQIIILVHIILKLLYFKLFCSYYTYNNLNVSFILS